MMLSLEEDANMEMGAEGNLRAGSILGFYHLDM
jgi:hypothetical protein